MDWIDSHSLIDESVNVGTYRINRLLSADNLVLLASLNRISNVCLISFLLRATNRECKSALKRPKYCVCPDPRLVYPASERHYTVAGGDAQLHWGDIHE